MSVGSRVITASVLIRVEGVPTTCFMYAEEYDSGDAYYCEACSLDDGDRKGRGCAKCEGTGYADANAWSVALGTTPENAKKAHAEVEDAHYTAPCWCGNEGTVQDRADWLADQAEDAGLSPFGEDEESPAIGAEAGDSSSKPLGPFGFDGRGINNLADPYHLRIATLTTGCRESEHDRIGQLLAAAPELRDMVRDLRDFITLADKKNRDMRKRLDALLKKVGA
jgi:hypothetical protein